MHRSIRLIGVLAGIALLAQATSAQTQLRVATWNVTNYSGGRTADFQTAIFDEFQGRSMTPDIIIGQEFLSASAVSAFVTILNTAPASTGDWTAADFVNGPDSDSAFFFRTTQVELATDLSANGVTVVAVGGLTPNHPRNIMRYDVVLAPNTAAEARLAIYSSHMKSGTTQDDLDRRLLEAQRIRDDAETLPAGWHFLLGGDFNIQASSQDAYKELVLSQVNNDGRFFDPIKSPGTWNNNTFFRYIHTQDPATAMDDRLDQILVSASLIDGLDVDYVGDASIAYNTTTWDDANHSYRCWGNDGTSFNAPITTTGNTMVGATIAQALIDSAVGGGHLPVYLDLSIPFCQGDLDGDNDVDLADLAKLLSNYGATSGATYSDGDLDGDGDVDLSDLAGLLSVYGIAC